MECCFRSESSRVGRKCLRVLVQTRVESAPELSKKVGLGKCFEPTSNLSDYERTQPAALSHLVHDPMSQKPSDTDICHHPWLPAPGSCDLACRCRQ